MYISSASSALSLPQRPIRVHHKGIQHLLRPLRLYGAYCPTPRNRYSKYKQVTPPTNIDSSVPSHNDSNDTILAEQDQKRGQRSCVALQRRFPVGPVREMAAGGMTTPGQPEILAAYSLVPPQVG